MVDTANPHVLEVQQEQAITLRSEDRIHNSDYTLMQHILAA